MKSILKHKVETRDLIKFLLLVAVLAGYFAYLSWKYDLATGGLVSLLTWSFFVLCTPIADAGFLVDFPVRLITGLRMFVSEMIVWTIAISSNLICLNWFADKYETTFLTSLLHKILTNPWPYWSIIVLCCIGTFLSVGIGDEMMDAVSAKVKKDKKSKKADAKSSTLKYRVAFMVVLFAGIVWGYYELIGSLGIKLPGE